jgi:hypothetical protein
VNASTSVQSYNTAHEELHCVCESQRSSQHQITDSLIIRQPLQAQRLTMGLPLPVLLPWREPAHRQQPLPSQRLTVGLPLLLMWWKPATGRTPCRGGISLWFAHMVSDESMLLFIVCSEWFPFESESAQNTANSADLEFVCRPTQAENPCIIFPDGAMVDSEIEVEGVTLTYSKMISISMMGYESYALPYSQWSCHLPSVSVVSVIWAAGFVCCICVEWTSSQCLTHLS